MYEPVDGPQRAKEVWAALATAADAENPMIFYRQDTCATLQCPGRRDICTIEISGVQTYCDTV